MTESVRAPDLGDCRASVLDEQRHRAVVRFTHWVGTFAFAALLISGIGILLSHPRFYWGETGGLGAPSLFDLPLPFMLGGPSGWGRYLHFQSAWVFVLNLSLYVGSGLASGHFQRDLVPAKGTLRGPFLWQTIAGHLKFERLGPEESLRYNVLQRIAYLAVIFGLLPLLLWTGLAMSPALTSVFPALVSILGGHQCARTIHFFATIALVLFVLVHIAMVWRGGFRQRVGAMITGGAAPLEENL